MSTPPSTADQERARRLAARRLLLEPLLLLLLATTCLLFTCLLAYRPDYLKLPLTLLIGWARYLNRVGLTLGVDWAGTATAAVCVAGLAVGLHLLRLNLDGPDRRPSVTVTVAMVGVVVLAFLAGVAVLSVSHQTGWLITDPEPIFDNRMFLLR